MNKKTELTKLQKAELAELLAQKTEEFKLLVGQPTLYAPKDPKPKPIKLGTPPIVPANLKEAEWQKYIEELMSGTYAPDLNFLDPPKYRYRERVTKEIKNHGPEWRDDEDGRGYKTKKKR